MTASLSPEQADAAKMDALQKFMKKVSKDHETRVSALGDATHIDVDAIPTGALVLDHATGIGGLPRGRVSELFGVPGAGKSTLALEAAKNCQDAGGVVGFIDAENALNRQLTTSIGIDESRFVINQPDYGEQGVAIAKEMMESGIFDMVIIDSAAALVPRAEQTADVEQAHMGLQARMLSKAMRLLTGVAATNNVALIVINQLRKNLAKYGTPDESVGGSALKYASSMRIEVRTSNSKMIKSGADIIGAEVTATVKKNKFASPSKPVEFTIMHGHGIDRAAGVLSVALELGVVEKSGNTHTLVKSGADLEPVSVKLGVGKQKANDALVDDPELFAAAEAAVKAAMSGKGLDELAASNDSTAEAEGETGFVAGGDLPPASAPDMAPEDDLFGLGS